MKTSLKDVQRFWDERARSGSNDCYRVDSSRRTQLMRFLAFAQLARLEGSSILDIGCGTGDFFEFLKHQEIHADYTGFDISPAMVERCQERFPDARFVSGDFLAWMPNRTFDYTVAIAIHNIKAEGARDILEATLRRQFELSDKAAHMSILSNRYEGFDSHIQAWDPMEILELAQSITPYVVFRHDYLPHDFSLTLFRAPTIDCWLGKQSSNPEG
ncbi:MAG: class I SAM-dependent methyltransferase [Nitrosomonadales bacterium]|nr:class I SAM-dependent methyltransferase [Nitrosomonadales bacterium]